MGSLSDKRILREGAIRRTFLSIILEYYGSKTWSPATLCPELALLPTRITATPESFQSVAVAKLCVSVDMDRETAAAADTGQIGAGARNEWEYIITLVTRQCLQGWLEFLAAYQFNEIPKTFEGSPNQPGAASVPWIRLKAEFPEVMVDLVEPTRQLLAEEEKEVLSTIAMVRHPDNNVEVPERLEPDFRNEVLRKMNVRNSTLQEFLDNAIAVFSAYHPPLSAIRSLYKLSLTLERSKDRDVKRPVHLWRKCATLSFSF